MFVHGRLSSMLCFATAIDEFRSRFDPLEEYVCHNRPSHNDDYKTNINHSVKWYNRESPIRLYSLLVTPRPS
jgi:hypothetical protein